MSDILTRFDDSQEIADNLGRIARKECALDSYWLKEAEVHVLGLFNAAKKLEVENERLREDAERYRWLRSIDTPPSKIWELVSDDCNPPYPVLKHGIELDAAIDAARKEGA